MATPSNMLPLDTIAPDFCLLDTVSNKLLSLAELKSPVATVIMFICNHCPYVKHLQAELVKFARQEQKNNISFIAISSNDAERYPEDAPAKMRDNAEVAGFTFPYLYDATQAVAKAYAAACTPDFYVFDHALKCVYRGQFDDARPSNTLPVTGNSLRAALQNLRDGKPPLLEQKPSIGCSIKWF